MASTTPQTSKLDRHVVVHVATTCDKHGVYVTKDSAEVVEIVGSSWMRRAARSFASVWCLVWFCMSVRASSTP
ncbi:hypothetical protein BDV96DRAFT_580506 [Lophiotrema nucula]|uniref:Uncharacterized protein n=1 Tax=Lophiotrema nucula TaxID=690887 RepID=A0A6A5YYX0_9PLEO|nr:hypothetical protein BDV96DRAFT_580506 [Lophiotrema nucula]